MPEGPEMRRAAGRQIRGVRARGKALIVDFAGGESIYTHNQLYGKWLVGPAGERPTTTRELRLALETRTHAALLYSASSIELLPTAAIDAHPYVRRLGVELLDPRTTLAHVRAQLEVPRFARQRLGTLLLEQGFLAGVGNYLRSEILFVARLHPDTRLGALDAAARGRLARSALAITRRAWRSGGVTNAPTIAAQLRRAGQPYAAYRHYVFDRDGGCCHLCGAPVRRILHSGRQLYLCVSCQPSPSESV